MAKPNNKLKVTKTADDSNLNEPEKQTTETSLQAAEDTIDDPPPEEHNVTIDHMGVKPATAKPPSPIKPTEEKADDVFITRLGYTASGNPTVLSKHNAKEELSISDKGKWSVNLESYA